MTNDEARGWLILIVTLLGAILLWGCVSAGGSPAQRLYEANANYAAALGAAADYAETPTADRSIVAKLNSVRKATQPAVYYVRAFMLCRGKPKTALVGDVVCALYDFSPGTLNSYALQLRSSAQLLLGAR